MTTFPQSNQTTIIDAHSPAKPPVLFPPRRSPLPGAAPVPGGLPEPAAATGNFSVAEALSGALWCRAAYGETPLPDGYTLGVNAEVKDFRPAADVQVLAARGNGRLVVAFRGTADVHGWLLDARVKLHPYGFGIYGIKVHSGFFSTVDAALNWLVPIVQAAAKDGLKVFIYGHSKGAAESMVCAFRLATEFSVRASAVYNYGCPRVFNRAGADAYNALGVPTFRVVNEDDTVTRIPFLLGLYRHAGRSAFIDHWLNIEVDEPWYAHLPSDVECAVEELFHRQCVLDHDHNIELYIQRLTAIRQAQQETKP